VASAIPKRLFMMASSSSSRQPRDPQVDA